MKRLQCELCMSIDIVKDGGYFVCQSCGCKYTIEEARKMMVGSTVEVAGTVDVQGTVQVDNTPYVQRYLANARRAMEKQDWEETEKYYNLVEQNDPDNIEAIFYSAYGKAMTTLVDGDIYKREAAFNVLARCISVIDDHYKTERWEENKDAIERMAQSLADMINASYVYNVKRNGYGVEIYNDSGKTRVLFAHLLDSFRESINNIEKVDDQPYLHSCLILLAESAMLVDWDNKQKMHALFNAWIAEEQEELSVLGKQTTETYWMIHPEELKELSEEKEELDARIGNLRNSIAQSSEQIEYERLVQEKDALTKRMDSLGLFKGKEKAALREQIKSVEQEIGQAKEAADRATAAYRSELASLEAKSEAVETQLTEVKDGISSKQRIELQEELKKKKQRYFENRPERLEEYEQCDQKILEAQRLRAKAYVEYEQAKAALNGAARKKASETIATCTNTIEEEQKRKTEIMREVFAE